MRIELFNKKTMHEVYNFNIEKHIKFDSNITRASLTSREKTLGPDCIYAYVAISDCVRRSMKSYVERCVMFNFEKAFIEHLNANVGVECLIKKEEIPLEIYDKIKA